MLVWAHHMFATPMPTVVLAFFMLSSFLIAVPTGVKIFNWVATLWRGTVEWRGGVVFFGGGGAAVLLGGGTRLLLPPLPGARAVPGTHLLVARLPSTAVGAAAVAGGG